MEVEQLTMTLITIAADVYLSEGRDPGKVYSELCTDVAVMFASMPNYLDCYTELVGDGGKYDDHVRLELAVHLARVAALYILHIIFCCTIAADVYLSEGRDPWHVPSVDPATLGRKSLY